MAQKHGEITDLITMVIHRSEWLTETHCAVGPHPNLEGLVDGDDLLKPREFVIEYVVDSEYGKYLSTVTYAFNYDVTKRELLKDVVNNYHWLGVHSPCESIEPIYDGHHDTRPAIDGEFFGLECRGGVYRPIMVWND